MHAPRIDKITDVLRESISVKQQLLSDKALLAQIDQAVSLIVTCFQTGHKLYSCGNGGSAADAQHLAAEFTGRFYQDRKALPAEALHCNTSYLTAVANDYSFDEVYARMVEGIGSQGDVLLGLTTSGNSQNIVKAFEKARKIGVITIGFTGLEGNKIKAFSDILFNIPSTNTPRIQECHITIGHIICQLVEQELFAE